jgi:hypothetical protein
MVRHGREITISAGYVDPSETPDPTGSQANVNRPVENTGLGYSAEGGHDA